MYAASQCFKVNIVVHQVCAPRYILQYESLVYGETVKDIHISYHGECHYNSVRVLETAIPSSNNPTTRIDEHSNSDSNSLTGKQHNTESPL